LTPNETNLKAAIAKAAAYEKVLQNPVSSVFSALGTAHAALTKSLNDGGSVVDAMAKIEAFTAQALTVATIYRELAAADNN
jgi:CMP-N-acetylneuraminic acid synthetase